MGIPNDRVFKTPAKLLNEEYLIIMVTRVVPHHNGN